MLIEGQLKILCLKWGVTISMALFTGFLGFLFFSVSLHYLLSWVMSTTHQTKREMVMVMINNGDGNQAWPLG